MKLLATPQPLSQALLRAMARGVLPSGLSSFEQREAFAKAVRQAAVFSARTTHAVYLDALKSAVERALQAGYNNDRGMLRIMLKQVLAKLGYTPETGFPGDEAHEIPEAKPGSLRDLSSDKRINLILDTQERLMHGAGQKRRGLERVDTFPAWELIRIFEREVPRGSEASGTKGWPDRWLDAGGKFILDSKGQTITDAQGLPRLIALKTDPVWSGLGDSAKFDDALDVDHPPFAFNSGKGWRELSAEEAAGLGVKAEVNGQPSTVNGDPASSLPPPKFSASRMSPEMKAALIEKLKGVPGKISTEQLGKLAREARQSVANALLGALKEAA